MTENILILKKKSKGFTLIELAISVAVLAIIAGILAPVVAQGIDVILLTKTQNQLLEEARFALRWMSREIKYHCLSLDTVASNNLIFNTDYADANWSQVNYECTNAPDGIHFQLERKTFDESDIQTGVSILISCLENCSIFGAFADPKQAPWGATSSDLPNIRVLQIRITVSDDSAEYSFPLLTRVRPLYRIQ